MPIKEIETFEDAFHYIMGIVESHKDSDRAISPTVIYALMTDLKKQIKGVDKNG